MKESTRLKHCFASRFACTLSFAKKIIENGEPILGWVNENLFCCADKEMEIPIKTTTTIIRLNNI